MADLAVANASPSSTASRPSRRFAEQDGSRRACRAGSAMPEGRLVERVMRTLARAIDGLELPAVEKISESQQEDPFQVLIATLLSARTQDATTLAASTRLFAKAPHAADDGEADGEADREADLSGQLLSEQGGVREGRVRRRSSSGSAAACPATMEELLTLPGVGRKTANLVLILAFKSQRQHLRRHARAPHLEPPGLGADAHARRDRAGALRDDRRAMVAVINLYLVTWGQNVCRPVYPRCGDCADRRRCAGASA